METMTTDKGAKPTKAPAKPPNAAFAEIFDQAGVPVYELIFAVGMNNKPDLPYVDAKGGIGRLRASADRTITLVSIKGNLFYRVVQSSRDVGDKMFCIPMAWATFEPLP
jgi:hypothetical protein